MHSALPSTVTRKDSQTEGCRDLGPSPLEFSPINEVYEEMTKDLDIGSRSTSSTASTCCTSSSSSSSSASSPSSSFFGKITASQSNSQLLTRVLPVAKSPPLIGSVRTQRVSLSGQQGRLTAALFDMAAAKRKEVRLINRSLPYPMHRGITPMHIFSFLLFPSLFLSPLHTVPPLHIPDPSGGTPYHSVMRIVFAQDKGRMERRV